jgi:hypothetical protein
LVPSKNEEASTYESENPFSVKDRRDDVLVTTKTFTTAPDDSSDSSSHESPPNFNGETHDDYYKKFVEFHQNPTMSRTRRPFATGRHRHRHRTHKCKPCKRRRPCTKKRRISHKRKRHYKKGRISHKKRRT